MSKLYKRQIRVFFC